MHDFRHNLHDFLFIQKQYFFAQFPAASVIIWGEFSPIFYESMDIVGQQTEIYPTLQ